MVLRHIQQSSYSMEWCRWVNVTFSNLVIPWNGVDGLRLHSTI
jgi:meiotically up-regulated gene 157 (Mug157) protein